MPAGRGVARQSKKGVDVEHWSAVEISRLDPLIQDGTKYLESELQRVTKEEGNSVEVIRLLKYLEERRKEARQAKILEASQSTGHKAKAAEERAYYRRGE